MRMCIPVEDDRGLNARIAGHVGRAPFHCIVDTATGSFEVRQNVGHDHGHRSDRCGTGGLIRSYGVDAVGCTQIGNRALAALRNGGIAVFSVRGVTVGAALREAQAGTLRPLIDQVCDGRGEGHGRGSAGSTCGR